MIITLNNESDKKKVFPIIYYQRSPINAALNS